MINGRKNKEVLTEEQSRVRNKELIGLPLTEEEIRTISYEEEDEIIDLDELLKELGLDGIEDDDELDDLEEGITYDISYKSPFSKRYSTVRKTFNDDKHFTNYYSLMMRKGYKIIGIEDVES